MPRRNRPKREEPGEIRFGSVSSPLAAPAGWQARRYVAREAGADYVCPSCGRGVPKASDHVVAWPDDEPDRRRHWHKGCWASAAREGLDRYRWT